MNTIINNIRLEQARLATFLVPVLEERYREFIIPKLNLGNSTSSDPEVLSELIKRDLYREIALSIRGYSDWLSVFLYKKNLLSQDDNFEDITDIQYDEICSKEGIYKEVLIWTIESLTDHNLPGVGKHSIQNGLNSIKPNVIELTAYIMNNTKI